MSQLATQVQPNLPLFRGSLGEGIRDAVKAIRPKTVVVDAPHGRVPAALLFPELAYDLFLDVVYVKGIVDITFARRAEWGHVPQKAAPA